MKVEALGYLIGAGSMTLGVEKAGFDVDQVWETPGYSKNAQTWDLNRPDKRHQIAELDWESPCFSSMQGLDLIYGNPPCSGLSSMTGMRLDAPVNNCMRQWIRMVVKARPRFVLMENAYQLSQPRSAKILADLANVLSGSGYFWWTWQVYSYQIGTPQIRRRTFLCGSLDKPANPHLVGLDDIWDKSSRSCINIIPCLEGLIGVHPSPDPVIDSEGRTVTQHWYGRWSDQIIELYGEWYERLWQPYYTPKDYKRAMKRAESGDKGAVEEMKANLPIYWPNIPDWFDGMSMSRPCICHSDRAMGTIAGGWKFVHPFDRRLMTMRELARVMGYPDEWQFHTYEPAYISQGVPVRSTMWAADRLLRTVGVR